MKFTKKILAALILTGFAAFTASAQLDVYSDVRTFLVTSPIQLNGNTIYSNKPVDLRGSIGVAKLDVLIVTNGAAGVGSFGVFTSPDLTNWTALGSVSIATNTTFNITNNVYAQQLVGTNAVLLPGGVVTPTAATAGFATPYVNTAPFTNSLSSVSANSGGAFSFGFDISSAANRYLSIQYTSSALNTNPCVSAILTTRRQQLSN